MSLLTLFRPVLLCFEDKGLTDTREARKKKSKGPLTKPSDALESIG